METCEPFQRSAEHTSREIVCMSIYQLDILFLIEMWACEKYSLPLQANRIKFCIIAMLNSLSCFTISQYIVICMFIVHHNSVPLMASMNARTFSTNYFLRLQLIIHNEYYQEKGIIKAMNLETLKMAWLSIRCVTFEWFFKIYSINKKHFHEFAWR